MSSWLQIVPYDTDENETRVQWDRKNCVKSLPHFSRSMFIWAAHNNLSSTPPPPTHILVVYHDVNHTLYYTIPYVNANHPKFQLQDAHTNCVSRATRFFFCEIGHKNISVCRLFYFNMRGLCNDYHSDPCNTTSLNLWSIMQCTHRFALYWRYRC